jgi:uncharacterized protein (DUF608 family)
LKKAIFWLVILALLVYSGFQFGIPYYRYTAFKTDAKEIARISLGEVEKTRAQIFLRAQELNIPIEEKEIMVTRTDKLVRVKTSWSESVNLFGIYQKTLNFTVNIQE